MGLGDRLRAWLRGESGGGRAPHPAAGGGRSTRGGGRGGTGAGRTGGRRGGPDPALDELEAFARSRRGVEAYLEPRTNLYGLSVLLVAGDGEYLRRPVPDEASVRTLCGRLGLPLYDARRVGYPRRVRDYDRGVRSDPVDLGDLPPWPGEEDGPPPPPTERSG
ncbi:MAG: hypothetical protein RLZZ353_836 [Actinomycetota bacterium]|jgi:hypothetical protein